MIAVFARLDLSTWLWKRQTLLSIALVIVFGIVVPAQGVSILAAALVTSVSVSVPFLHDERWRLDTMYGLLPVSRRAVVAGRAVSLAVYFAVAMIVAIAATIVVAVVRGNSMQGDVVLLTSALAVGLVGMSLSLQLPVLFRLGFARGRFIVYAPPLLIAIIAWVAQATGLLSASALSVGALPIGAIATGAFVIGALGFGVAIPLASRQYAKRDL
jgi:hypothetical protein